MKITLAISQLSGGGAERVLIKLANHFHACGIDVELLVTNQSEMNGITSALEQSVPVIYLQDLIARQKHGITLGRKINSLLCRGFQTCGIETPAALLEKSFAYSYDSYVKKTRKLLAERKGAVVLAFLQPTTQIILKAAEELNVSIFLSERADPYRYFQTRYAKYFLRKYYNNAKGMVFQTNDAQKAYAPYIRMPSTVIPNPVSSEIPQSWSGERKKTIVNFCRLAKQKNLPMLIDAFELFWETHPDYTLEIYGNGEEKDRVVSYIAGKQCRESISLYAHSADVHRQVLDAGMFVSSSDYEGMSNSMLEAMAMGLPTICTDCPIGGASTVIEDHENGILVPVGDVASMAAAMSEIADQPELARRIGKRAEQIREDLNEYIICERWLEFINCNMDKGEKK